MIINDFDYLRLMNAQLGSEDYVLKLRKMKQISLRNIEELTIELCI